MEPLDNYVSSAERLNKQAFAFKYPMMFLLKRPSGNVVTSGPITFRTQTVTMNDHGLIVSESVPFNDGYWVWPLLKKSGNPFPERISVGRASNCDVVFRLGYVSKLHAHFVLNGAIMTLADQDSANGTELNGERMEPNIPYAVKAGDRIKLGRLELRLLDAEGFYDMLEREVLPAY